MRYREVVSEVSRRIGVGFEEAKSAAEAAVTVLARALNETDRERFLGKVPAELHADYAVNVPFPPRGVEGFVEEVGRISHRTPDVARYQAQTVISVLSEQDGGLVESLYLPPDLRDLVAPPAPAGGGLVGPDGRTSPLSDDELRAALGRLPYWSGNGRALTRTITLPGDNLDRVLAQIEGVRRELGRGPRVTRSDRENATLVVRTTRVDAVTAPDVELAHRLDDAIDQAGAGIA
jgi:pterin-4a-carbinolamine dehydratase